MIDYLKRNKGKINRHFIIFFIFLLLLHLLSYFLHERGSIGYHGRPSLKAVNFSRDGSLLGVSLSAFSVYILDKNRWQKDEDDLKFVYPDIQYEEETVGDDEGGTKNGRVEVVEVIRTGDRVFEPGKNLVIRDVKKGKVKRLTFKDGYLPFAVSDGGALAVWLKRTGERSFAVVYDVDKDSIINEIPLEDYGNGPWEFALNLQRRLLCVGYERKRRTNPKFVLFEIDSKKQVREIVY